MSSDLSHLSKVPEHVPDELVVEYNLLTGKTLERCPQMLPVEHQDRPVLFSPLHGGFWVLTRYKEVREALQDAETFGQVGTIPRMPNPHPNIPNSLDPPELLKWRQLMLPLFAPKRVAALEPVYRELARERLDLIAPKGRCEFVAEYAQVLPVWRFCKQLGLPADRSQEFAQLSSDATYGHIRVAMTEGVEAAAKYRADLSEKIFAIMTTVVEERHRQPGDDIASVLIEARMDDEPIDDEDIINILTFLYNAGTDTTSSAIAMAMHHLATHPEDRRTLAATRRIPDGAIEELLRVNTNHYMSRVAHKDGEISGIAFKKGDLFALSLAGGSRDPDEFTDPNVAHLDRPINRHLAFGLGVHRCLGIHQARLEMRVALEEFFHRIPEFELEPGFEIRWKAAINKSSIEAIPLVFEPS